MRKHQGEGEALRLHGKKELPTPLNLSAAHSWLASWIHPQEWWAGRPAEESEAEPGPDCKLLGQGNNCFKPVSFVYSVLDQWVTG